MLTIPKKPVKLQIIPTKKKYIKGKQKILTLFFHTRIPLILPVVLFSLDQLDVDMVSVWFSDEGKMRYKPQCILVVTKPSLNLI